jgi:hypothetical protein
MKQITIEELVNGWVIRSYSTEKGYQPPEFHERLSEALEIVKVKLSLTDVDTEVLV